MNKKIFVYKNITKYKQALNVFNPVDLEAESFIEVFEVCGSDLCHMQSYLPGG